MDDVNRWEYRVETFRSAWGRPKDADLEEALNEWGEEGWEVIGLAQDSSKILVLARRPLTLATRRRRSLPGE